MITCNNKQGISLISFVAEWQKIIILHYSKDYMSSIVFKGCWHLVAFIDHFTFQIQCYADIFYGVLLRISHRNLSPIENYIGDGEI